MPHKIFCLLMRPLIAFFIALIAGFGVALLFSTGFSWTALLLSAATLLVSITLFGALGFSQLGLVVHIFSRSKDEHPLPATIKTGLMFFKGKIPLKECKRHLLAPELALQQFVQQVKSYAAERSFIKKKESVAHISGTTSRPMGHLSLEPGTIMRRRWNDVMDSLNELEMYLTNDPKAMIERLTSDSPLESTDVSKLFWDVAETFDATWRRRGINIEHAIVTPLKASFHEPLLRRLLVGPWRTCAYFALKGQGVVFSAKTEKSRVYARWECTGVTFSEAFYTIIQDTSRPVNERIEQGLALVAADPTNSPNALLALMSFVVWKNLVSATTCEHRIYQGSSGLIIELIL